MPNPNLFNKNPDRRIPDPLLPREPLRAGAAAL